MLLPIVFSLLLFPIRSYGQDIQKVLEPADYSSFASASGENWSVREQDDSLCKAGSRHFAGSVNVTDDKSLFFCELHATPLHAELTSSGFFESRKDPNNRPVIIWLNGFVILAYSRSKLTLPGAQEQARWSVYMVKLGHAQLTRTVLAPTTTSIAGQSMQIFFL